jgi:hypothetical protein
MVFIYWIFFKFIGIQDKIRFFKYYVIHNYDIVINFCYFEMTTWFYINEIKSQILIYSSNTWTPWQFFLMIDIKSRCHFKVTKINDYVIIVYYIVYYLFWMSLLLHIYTMKNMIGCGQMQTPVTPEPHDNFFNDMPI